MMHLLLLLLVPFVKSDRVVQTNSGPIRGISLDAKNVEAFLGIPFAEPPVGNLRFARPVPKSPWTEVLDANELPVACVQCMAELNFYNESDKMDEDCLYLNLWVPRTDTPLKPIMVFIYGGGFMGGSASVKIYDGANLAQHGDVIVASMNYRVGTLGFFSAFIDEAAGSMGMYDQVLAIQWIKDNAKHFGGDPDNIVIFGESAGAYSVSLHLVSPLSKHLIRRAILQSGSAANPLHSNDNHVLRKGSQMISKYVGCADTDEDLKENPKYVVECMKSLPAKKFTGADEILLNKLEFLVPRVGDEFLPTNPTDLFRNGKFKDTEVLIGVTSNEGSMFTTVLSSNEAGDWFGKTFDANVFTESTAKKNVQPFMKDENYDEIFQSYFQRVKKESRYTHLDAASDILGDHFVTCPTVFQADFQSIKKIPVYFYVFDYRTPSSLYPEWMGVPHFEETPYVFGNPLHKTFSESEENLSKDMMNMWIAFAKTGNPNIPSELNWPKYTYEDPKYLIISMRDKVGVKPDNYRCENWRNVFRSTIENETIRKYKQSKTEL